jgi:hypothetical protein
VHGSHDVSSVEPAATASAAVSVQVYVPASESAAAPLGSAASSTSWRGWDPQIASNGLCAGVTSVKVRYSPSNDQFAVTVSALSLTSMRSRNAMYWPTKPASWFGGSRMVTVASSITNLNVPVGPPNSQPVAS